MSIETEKIIEFVVSLNKLTSEDRLKWSVTNPPKQFELDTDAIVSSVYVADYKSNKFRIYEQKRKLSHQERIFQPNNFDLDWSVKVILEYLNTDSIVLWTCPYVSALDDLLSTIKYKVANIQSLMDLLRRDREQQS